MTIKFLDLNILKGFRLKQVINFIKNENFDIIQLQEVTGGKFSNENNVDCFELISNNLTEYQGERGISLTLTNDQKSYFSNATFFKQNIKLITKELIVFKKSQILDFPRQVKFEDYARNALCLILKIKNQNYCFINTHQAWSISPDDTKEKIRQGEILIKYIQNLQIPFILSGDFNVDNRSQIINRLNKISSNITLLNKVTNTLNPQVHRAKHLFPPGLVVDFIFTSTSIKVNQFNIYDQLDLSDHFGQSIVFNIS